MSSGLIEFYPQIKAVHIACITASGSLFAIRGAGVLSGARWPLALPVRWLSYAIDTTLLTPAPVPPTLLPVGPVRPGGAATPTPPGTASVRSRALTARSVPARGIGSIITPDAAVVRVRSERSMPSACRSTTSSKAIPAPNRKVRAQRPPIVRAATSMSVHCSPSTRTSA